jgi:hypothetical protein
VKWLSIEPMIIEEGKKKKKFALESNMLSKINVIKTCIVFAYILGNITLQKAQRT